MCYYVQQKTPRFIDSDFPLGTFLIISEEFINEKKKEKEEYDKHTKTLRGFRR